MEYPQTNNQRLTSFSSPMCRCVGDVLGSLNFQLSHQWTIGGGRSPTIWVVLLFKLELLNEMLCSSESRNEKTDEVGPGSERTFPKEWCQQAPKPGKIHGRTIAEVL